MELIKRHECCLKDSRKRTARAFKKPEEDSNVKLCRCLRVKDQSVLLTEQLPSNSEAFEVIECYCKWLRFLW